MSSKTSLFSKVSLEDYGLATAPSTENFSLESATAELGALTAGLSTSFVVFGHAQLMDSALESCEVEVSAQTQEVIDMNAVTMGLVIDSLDVSIEEDDAGDSDGDDEPGLVGKAWRAIKAFFASIAAWFKKQWVKLKGMFSGLKQKIKDKYAEFKSKRKVKLNPAQRDTAIAALKEVEQTADVKKVLEALEKNVIDPSTLKATENLIDDADAAGEAAQKSVKSSEGAAKSDSPSDSDVKKVKETNEAGKTAKKKSKAANASAKAVIGAKPEGDE